MDVINQGDTDADFSALFVTAVASGPPTTESFL